MYVIDGYNLMHNAAMARVLPRDGSRARARLIELVAHLARRESTRALVFFDGTPADIGAGELAHELLQVRFCGPERESADREIRAHVQNHRQPEKLRVVTSDGAVAAACKLAGAKVLKAHEMAARLAKLATESRAPRGGSIEKPTRGRVGRIEQEMLDEIGDEAEFEREILRGIRRRRPT